MEDRSVEAMRKEIVRLREIVEAMGAAETDERSKRKSSVAEDHHDQLFRTSEYGNKRPKMATLPTMSGNKAYQVFVRSHDSNDKTLNVRDGYQWRKYGQKVTKDNPSPRAYFRCAMAPTCPVKKKVQRSVEDPTILVVSYEGQHNHNAEADHQATPPQTLDNNSSTIQTPKSFTISNSNANPFVKSTVTLDLSLSGTNTHNQNTLQETPSSNSTPSFDLFRNVDLIKNEEIIKEYVASLTRDPSFSMALAMAVARCIPDMSRPT